MELDAEGGLGLMGKAGLPGGQVLHRGDSLGGSQDGLGQVLPPWVGDHREFTAMSSSGTVRCVCGMNALVCWLPCNPRVEFRSE